MKPVSSGRDQVFLVRLLSTPNPQAGYLSRYTHRVAIGNSRIIDFDGQTVRFRCRRPKLPGQRKPRYGVEILTAEAFITRFMTHILPTGFHRIRHFGIFANGCRRNTLDTARTALDDTNPEPQSQNADTATSAPGEISGKDIAKPPNCPDCGTPLQYISVIPAGWKRPGSSRDPPQPVQAPLTRASCL